MKLIILITCVFLEVCLGNDPQVYEKADDQIQIESNARVVRQPFVQTRPRVYQPPKFQYQETLQQDPRKRRYAQQQRLDMINILRNQIVKTPEGPLRVSLAENWKAGSKIESYKLPERKVNETNHSKVSQATRKPVTSRKMNPDSYYDDKIKRQDTNQVVYMPPGLTHNRRSEYDLNALSSLVGQDPNSQLAGLHRLLQTPQSNLVLSPIKSAQPHPITEEVEDIPNPNTHPNVNTNLALQNLQAQFDEAAKAQVAQALAEAQKEAQAHVDAQHRAIAKAHADAQQKALAQIKLHNERIRGEALPQALPLVSEAEARPEALPQPLPVVYKPEGPRHGVTFTYKPEVAPPAPGHDGEHRQPRVTLVYKPEGHGDQHRQPSLTVYKPEGHGDQHRQQSEVPAADSYAPSHQHLKAPKANLKKISITKTHSVTQRQSPNAYQQVVLETQQSQDKVHPGVNQLKFDENVDEHQYAARYAFGYKIRDAKMGSEFGHEEKRDGENAKGLYHVLLPDGRMQKVEYYVDPSGYHAKVTYENLAHH